MNLWIRSPRHLPIWLLALGGSACAWSTPHRPWQDQDYPGSLQPAAAFPTDLLWQQRVTATWTGGERGFDAAVQKQGDELKVIGLSPLGSAGFAMILHGTTIELKNDMQQELPFPPRFILLDVQRTFYPWLPEPTPSDGSREGDVGEEHVAETWRDGRLQERRFTRLDGTPAGAIVITYEWGAVAPEQLAPARTVLSNGWFGYRLTVDTHQETRLPAADGA